MPEHEWMFRHPHVKADGSDYAGARSVELIVPAWTTTNPEEKPREHAPKSEEADYDGEEEKDCA